MSADFKGTQLRTNQIIASRSSGEGIRPSLIIMSASSPGVLTPGDGTYTSSTLLAGVGSDVWMFVSGAAHDKGVKGVVLMGGDLVVSGTLYAEKQVIEVDETVTGSLSVSGSLFVQEEIRGAREYLRDDLNVSGSAYVAGNMFVSGALSMATNQLLYFNGPSGDHYIKSNDTTLTIDGDNYVRIDAGITFSVYGGTTLNHGGADADFRVRGETGAMQGAILFDAGAQQLGLLTDGTTAGNAYGLNASTEPIPGYVGLFISGAVGSANNTTAASSLAGGAVLMGGDLVVSGAMHLQNVVEPTVQAAGESVLYTNSGLLYFKNAGGTATAVGSGAGGGADNVGWTAPAADQIATTGSLVVSGALSIGESGTGSDVIFYGEDANAVGLHWDADYAEHGALLLGVDNHGVDLIVRGETPTRFLYWDQSTDTLKLLGHFIFNDGAYDLDFRAESQNIPGMIVIDSGTDQLLLHASGTTAATAGGTGFQAGSDVATYISGTVGSAGVAHSKGATLVTGDLVLSGALSLEVNEKLYFNGQSGDQFIYSSNGNNLLIDSDDQLRMYATSSINNFVGDISLLSLNPELVDVNPAANNTDFVVKTPSNYNFVIDCGTDQTFIGTGARFAAEVVGGAGSDIRTYISGTCGSQNTSGSFGTTMVAGDLMVSGTVLLERDSQDDAPQLLLHEVNTGGARLSFTNTAGSSGVTGHSYEWTVYADPGSDGAPSGADMRFYYADADGSGAGADILTIQGNYSVGINDTSPSYNLDINGDCRITEGLQVNTDLGAYNFRVGSDTKQGAVLMDGGAQQIGLLTDGTTAADAYGLNASGNPIPNDVGLFISGAIGSVGTTSATESERYGAVLIGGDLVVSGTIYEQTPATLSFYVGTDSNALASKLAIFDEDNYASFTETNMITSSSIGFDEATGAFSLYQARPHMVTMNLTMFTGAIITVKISVEADSVEIFTVSPMVHSSVDPVERTVSFLVAGPTVAEMNAGTSKELIFYVTPPSSNVTIVAGTSITIYAV